MFILDHDSIAHYDIEAAYEFVLHWRRFYKNEITAYGTNNIISYIEELNLGNDLTEDNVKKLLRWKDPHSLTEKIMSGVNRGTRNSKVYSVLNNLDAINKFRNDIIDEPNFRNIVDEIFPNGTVFSIYLFHIAQPDVFPIADQNVFRTFDLHNNNAPIEFWEKYPLYKVYFNNIFNMCNFIVNDRTALVENRKKVDEALFEFGKFIKKYYKE